MRLTAVSSFVAVAAAAAPAPWLFSRGDPSATYNFLAIGDWGDDSVGQAAAAAGMGAVAAEINAHQVFALGDNFYHSNESHCKNSGICPDNADGIDGVHRFKSTFEDVYTHPNLKSIPFYAIAGNHDHGGNVTAEIAYTTNDQNLKLIGSSGIPGAPLPPTRWTYPDHWHNVTQHFTVGGKEVELEVLLFDSCIMVGNSDGLYLK